jgi:hypothetical protein
MASSAAAVPEVLNLNFQFSGMNLCITPSGTSFPRSTGRMLQTGARPWSCFLIPFISAALSWLLMKVTNNAAGGRVAGQHDAQHESHDASHVGVHLASSCLRTWASTVIANSKFFP